MPSSGTYTTTTLAQAVSAVSARLSDPGQVHWSAAELTQYLYDALRTWNALTSTFKGTITFNTSDPALNSNTPFFDLPTLAPGLRGYTYTTDDAMYMLEYMLLEALSAGTAWNGTDQFGYDDLRSALQRRRDQFLLETAARVERTLIATASPPDGRVPLPETLVTLRRLAWVALDGTITPLQREDEWSANAYMASWVQHPAATPRVYSVAATAPLYAQLIPVPSVSGTLDLCRVPRGADLTPTIPLGIPDDWVWVVIFGGLADLLGRDGLALDAQRAQYCEQRWQHGLRLAQSAPCVLTARINNVVCPVGALPDLDQFSASWQTTVGQPRRVVTLGQNLLIPVPPPSANAPSGWSISCDVVRNALLPASPSAYLQIGPEQLDVIYDYAQHLALFKEGAAAVATAQPLLDRFFRAAGVEATWQQALARSRKALLGQQSQDRRGASPNHDSNADIQTGVSPGASL